MKEIDHHDDVRRQFWLWISWSFEDKVADLQNVKGVTTTKLLSGGEVIAPAQ